MFSQSTQQLYVQAVRVYPMSFGEAATRRTISRSLCSPDGIGPLSPFFKEVTYKDTHCHPTVNAAVVAARQADSDSSTDIDAIFDDDLDIDADDDVPTREPTSAAVPVVSSSPSAGNRVVVSASSEPANTRPAAVADNDTYEPVILLGAFIQAAAASDSSSSSIFSDNSNNNDEDDEKRKQKKTVVAT